IHLWRLESAQPPDEPERMASTRSKSVLVVDANPDSADTLAAILGTMGHRAEVAYSALSALSAVERLRPDAVLLDLDLPRMSGYAVAQRLRAQPQLRSILLVALSGDREEAAAQAA